MGYVAINCDRVKGIVYVSRGADDSLIISGKCPDEFDETKFPVEVESSGVTVEHLELS